MLDVRKKDSTNNLEPKIQNLKPKHAFTLIEVLVVVALIGVLATFTVFTVISAQKKARDTQRKHDLALVKRLLEQAKNDCKNAAYYPTGTIEFLDLWDVQRFGKLNGQLINSGYTNSAFQDPTVHLNYSDAASLYYYGFDYTNDIANNVCPNSSGALTIPGAPAYYLRAKLESRDNAELKKSWLACQPQINNQYPFTLFGFPGSAGMIPPPTDDNFDNIDDYGFFYVCND